MKLLKLILLLLVTFTALNAKSYKGTLEISNYKILPANQLVDYWEYNYKSFLNYLEQALYGLQGRVTDSITGNSIAATVFIEDHDMDNSWVVSNPVHGK